MSAHPPVEDDVVFWTRDSDRSAVFGTSIAVSILVLTIGLVLPHPASSHLSPPPDGEATSLEASTRAAYEMLSFQIPEEAFPVSVVFVGDPVDELNTDDVTDAIEVAIDAWNRVPCSYAQLSWKGVRDSNADVADNEIAIQFSDDFSEIPETIALFTWPEPEPPLGIDIYLNTLSYQWSTTPELFPDFVHADRPSVVLSAAIAHELGHALGLDHTEAHNAATMAAHYLPDGSQDELSADDKLGLCHLYSQSGSECHSHADCGGAAECVSGEYGDVCDIYLADVGEYCDSNLEHCRDTCHIDDRGIGIGYCTTSCDDDTDCPDQFHCSRAADHDSHCERSAEYSPSNGCISVPRSRQSSLVAVTLLAVWFLGSVSARRRH